jgi:hypothetical protein
MDAAEVVEHEIQRQCVDVHTSPAASHRCTSAGCSGPRQRSPSRKSPGFSTGTARCCRPDGSSTSRQFWLLAERVGQDHPCQR